MWALAPGAVSRRDRYIVHLSRVHRQNEAVGNLISVCESSILPEWISQRVDLPNRERERGNGETECIRWWGEKQEECVADTADSYNHPHLHPPELRSSSQHPCFSAVPSLTNCRQIVLCVCVSWYWIKSSATAADRENEIIAGSRLDYPQSRKPTVCVLPWPHCVM